MGFCLLRFRAVLVPGSFWLALLGLVSCGEEPVSKPHVKFAVVDGVTVDCTSATFSDLAEVKRIYDRDYGAKLPTNDQEFGWRPDGSVASEELLNKVGFFPLPSNLGDDPVYAGMQSYTPGVYERGTGRNADIFGGFNAEQNPEQAYRRYNPRDYSPAAATHYGRDPQRTTDVMAQQYLFHKTCSSQFQAALQRCPTCADFVAMLSPRDLHRIFDVRFVRVKDGTIEVSKVFKVISVDASGSPKAHAQRERMSIGSVNGRTLKAQWRLEISGLMAQHLSTYGGPTGLVIRLAEENNLSATVPSETGEQSGDASAPPPSGGGRGIDGGRSCSRDCHAWACNRDYNLDGWHWWKTADCGCYRDTHEPPTTAIGKGTCEAWNPHNGGSGNAAGGNDNRDECLGTLDCHAWACNRDYDLGGWHFWKDADCKCRRDKTAPQQAVYKGVCEAWDPDGGDENGATLCQGTRDCHAWACNRDYNVGGWNWWKSPDCSCHRDRPAAPSNAIQKGTCESWEPGANPGHGGTSNGSGNGGIPNPRPGDNSGDSGGWHLPRCGMTGGPGSFLFFAFALLSLFALRKKFP